MAGLAGVSRGNRPALNLTRRLAKLPLRLFLLYTTRMFVRWTSRARRTSEFGPDWEEPDVHHRAILVEAVRIDGKPRQRHVAHLVGFTESRAQTAHRRVNLWDEISERLDKLGEGITDRDRDKVEAAVTIKLPKPTAAERRNARYGGTRETGRCAALGNHFSWHTLCR